MVRFFKKTIITTLGIFLCTAVSIAVAFLIFGTGEITIADYFPPVPPSQPPFYIEVILHLILHLSMLAIPITAIALPQTILLCKKKIFSAKKDIVIILLFWIVPLIFCAIKLVPQYTFSW